MTARDPSPARSAGPPPAAGRVRLGLRANLAQFSLLVAVNALAGGTLGQERTVVQLLAEQTFHLAALSSALTFILAFGAVKAVTNFFAGTLSDRIGRKRLIATGMAVQAAAIAPVALGTTVTMWAVAAVMLGAGTAMVYPTLLAAIGDVDHPAWRARSVGVYRLWRDGGFAVGAVLAGAIADAFGILAAIWAVAVLTAASGLVVAVRMYETRPPTRPERDRRAVGRQGRSPGPARLLRRMARSAPSLKATLDIGRPCQAQLLQSRRRQAGLMTLIAYHDDVLTQLRRTGVAVPARGIQPPFRTFRPITSAWWPRGGQSTRACRA